MDSTAPTMSSTNEDATVEVRLNSSETKKLVPEDVADMSAGELKNLMGEMAELTRALAQLGAKDEETVPLKVEEQSTDKTADPNEKAAQQEAEVEEEAEQWSESCYTLVYICPILTHGFWHGLGIVGLQILTISLVLVSIVSWDDPSNPLGIPPMVEEIVACAQAVALYMAVPFMADLIQAVQKLQDGFYPELTEGRPAANFPKWLISCTLQLISGLILLADIFILTMQATDVIGIMLNFAALHFMADIDNLGFQVATWGFVSNSLQEQALECEGFAVPKRNKGYILRRVLYAMCLAMVFAGYAVIKHDQLRGNQLHSVLYVQFGDTYDSRISYYSGLFKAEYTYTAGHRRYTDIATNQVSLGYCSNEGAWAFTDHPEDPCNPLYIFAKSETTKSFDVTSIPDYQWLIKDNSTDRFTLFGTFELVGRDCDSSLCQGECGEDGFCYCDDNRFGLDCEFEDVCQKLAISAIGGPFPPDPYGWATSQSYELFKDPDTGKPVRAYNMPVFYSNSTIPANFIFFGGLRWVLTSEGYLNGNNQTGYTLAYSGGSNPDEIADYLNSDTFHGHHEMEHIPIFMSDRMDFESTGFQPTPAGLEWYIANPVGENETHLATSYAVGDPINVFLECQNCNLGGTCNPYGGICNETTGNCDCDDLWSGDRCDIQKDCFDQDWPCGGKGICDDSSGICRCFRPYYGKLCQTDFWCMEERGSCFNGGICEPTEISNQTVKCDCVDPATSGTSCEKKQDCTVFGCENGGICNRQTEECSCREPYHGVACDLINATLLEEGNNDCQSDDDCGSGICFDETGICDCNGTGTFGLKCEHEFVCSKDSGDPPCRGHGICSTANDRCICQEPYTGFDCSELPDCTSDEDCVGEGRCDAAIGNCICEDRFTSGKLCEETFHCEEDGCANEGNCHPAGYCQCELPYTGLRCEYIMEEAAYKF